MFAVTSVIENIIAGQIRNGQIDMRRIYAAGHPRLHALAEKNSVVFGWTNH